MTVTWHIRKIRNSVGLTAALELRLMQELLESQGFSVAPLPAEQCGFSISHSHAGQLTILLLQKHCFADWQVLSIT
jgi:hypothetical protein